MRMSRTISVTRTPHPAAGGKGLSMSRTTGGMLVVLMVMLGSILTPGGVSANPTDKCVAANGEVRMQQGTATCEATGRGSVARVQGTTSTAVADGDHNMATVTGDGSTATASNGEGNTATVCDWSRLRVDGVSDTDASAGCQGR